MVKIQNTVQHQTLTKIWNNKNSHSCWWECKMVHSLWKPVWQFLTKVDIVSPYYLAIALLGIYPNSWKLCPIKPCTQMVIAAVLLIARTWKHPRCPSVGECISKLWNIQTMKYYIAIKNELHFWFPKMTMWANHTAAKYKSLTPRPE